MCVRVRVYVRVQVHAGVERVFQVLKLADTVYARWVSVWLCKQAKTKSQRDNSQNVRDMRQEVKAGNF